jgi:hypothetical protein
MSSQEEDVEEAEVIEDGESAETIGTTENQE